MPLITSAESRYPDLFAMALIVPLPVPTVSKFRVASELPAVPEVVGVLSPVL